MESKDYILYVSVDPKKVKECSGSSDIEEAISSEAGWMEESGIYVQEVEEAQPEPSNYVYKEHNDSYAYGEEVVEIYKTEMLAQERLKKSVEDRFGVPFDEVPKAAGFTDSDTFKKDYVSFYNGNATEFWIVTRQPVLDSIPQK